MRGVSNKHCLLTFFITEVTLSALNAPESDVDIEGLGDTGASKKLDFDSGIYNRASTSLAFHVNKTPHDKLPVS